MSTDLSCDRTVLVVLNAHSYKVCKFYKRAGLNDVRSRTRN
jgi:hypothetical protein